MTTRSLGGLYGFFLKEGDAVGIVLNDAHPEYLQRYTCAHELGHHVLGHTSHLDHEEQIEKRAVDGRWDELAAQTFAGAFLMPLQSLNRVHRRLGISRERAPSAGEVYLISRELDVSFAAAAWQLVSLNRLDAGAARDYIRRGAAAAKNALRPGPSPTGDNRAGLAVLGLQQNGLPVLCRTGDELRVRLPENASTGYVWRFLDAHPADRPGTAWDGEEGLTAAAADPAASSTRAPASSVRLLHERYAPQDGVGATAGTVIGHGGLRELVFIAEAPGSHEIRAQLGRPWEPGAVDEFRTRVRVAPRHSVSGFAEAQRRSYIARLIGA
nr:protease inhibitor I42 family protein [Cellulosimicrobium aquatile]